MRRCVDARERSRSRGGTGDVVVAPTAAHAATCHAFTCASKDPQATGCAADAITAKSKVSMSRTVELRHSPTCRLAWARIRNGIGADFARIENTAGHVAATVMVLGVASIGVATVVGRAGRLGAPTAPGR